MYGKTRIRRFQAKAVSIPLRRPQKNLLTMLTASETQSFLHDPVHKIDTFYTSNEFQPYKDNTGRQLRHILVAGSARWAITAVMCICYVAATLIWKHKPAQSEGSKRVYNTITTGISIALGLNIASAFKDMALNIRWVILSNRKRNLVEVSTAFILPFNRLQCSRWTSSYTQTLCRGFLSLYL